MSTGATILFVEDNADDMELTLHALKNAGVKENIDVVQDGQEALDYLFAVGKFEYLADSLPSVVFLDLKLPKINGLEVLRRLRANDRTKHLPVVILSTSIEQSDLTASYKLGVNSYLQKPTQYNEFVSVIQRAILYWSNLNRQPLPGR